MIGPGLKPINLVFTTFMRVHASRLKHRTCDPYDMPGMDNSGLDTVVTEHDTDLFTASAAAR